MRAPYLAAALIFLGTAQAQAQTIGPVDPGAPVDVGRAKSVTVNGVSGVTVRPAEGASQGYMVPDASGGYVYFAPGPPTGPASPDRVDAEEIRLYARELAAQITGGPSGQTPLTGLVSVPSAFVDQDSGQSSSFGRLLGEQLTYELSSRGFPVKEMRGAAGTTASARRAPKENLAVLAGNYYVDQKNLFVNARLVEPSGRVARTASVLIPMSPTLRRMLGIQEPGGMKLVSPTIIGARDVSEPPNCSGQAVPYTPAHKYSPGAKKRPAAKRTTHVRKAPAKSPCPPGCEPIDTAKKSGQPAPAGPK